MVYSFIDVIGALLLVKWQYYIFNLKILFSKKFSDSAHLIMLYAKLTVYRKKMVSVFWLEPYLGQKWLILVVFVVFTWNQWSKYGLYRYIYDRHDLTDAVEQKFFLITNYADLDHHYSFSLKISQIRSDHLIFPFSKNEPVPIPFPPKMIYIVIWSRLF